MNQYTFFANHNRFTVVIPPSFLFRLKVALHHNTGRFFWFAKFIQLTQGNASQLRFKPHYLNEDLACCPSNGLVSHPGFTPPLSNSSWIGSCIPIIPMTPTGAKEGLEDGWMDLAYTFAQHRRHTPEIGRSGLTCTIVSSKLKMTHGKKNKRGGE